MVERATNRLKLFPVDTRDATTLMTLIKDHVIPGSTVITDTLVYVCVYKYTLIV